MKVSQIPGDDCPIVASFGPSDNDRKYEYKCRGRTIYRTKLTESDSHGKYRLCMFADTKLWQWLNEENIRGFKREGVGIIEVINVEEAA